MMSRHDFRLHIDGNAGGGSTAAWWMWPCVAAIMLAAIMLSDVLVISPAAAPEIITRLDVPAGPEAGMYALSADGAQGALLSWLEPSAGGHALRLSIFDGRRWQASKTIVDRADLFVNWADHPSIASLADGTLATHWLVKNPGDGTKKSYAYGHRIAISRDRGTTWREVFADGQDNVHSYSGFVSLLASPSQWLAVYLTPPRPLSPDPSSHTMTLSHVAFDRGGKVSGRGVVDGDTCSCCPTATALTATGPIVAYRDHEPGEIRDIAIVRLIDGAWTTPRPVHRDGWEIHGCPTNGPALTADGAHVAAAWFTAAGDAPRLNVAFSNDSGATFEAPVVVDDATPIGRPALVSLGDRAVAVAWLAQSASDAAKTELRLRRVTPAGTLGPIITAGAAAGGRVSGMPQMLRLGDTLMLAWRGERLSTVRIPIARL